MADLNARGVHPKGDHEDDIHVMVVDDALVIRGMLTRILEQQEGIHVVSSVGDGLRALDALDRYDVDVVVLDIEMPRMDGLTALPKIIEKVPGIQVLMASTLTLRNAEISIKALRMGAADYVSKPTTSGELHSAEDFKREIVDKVKALGPIGRRRRMRRVAMANRTTAATKPAFRAAQPSPTAARSRPAAPKGRIMHSFEDKDEKPLSLRPGDPYIPDLIAIGSSTGGPQALFALMKDIGSEVTQPILITQHMPPAFTTILAEHVQKACGRPTQEGQDGLEIKPGNVYIAPGDFHMVVEIDHGVKRIRLNQNPPENFCRPAVDPLFRSIASAYGNKALGVVLTGMGSDGCKGAGALVKAGAQILAQDKETSVVWGMPGAVAQAGLCTKVSPLSELGPLIRKYALGARA